LEVICTLQVSVDLLFLDIYKPKVFCELICAPDPSVHSVSVTVFWAVSKLWTDKRPRKPTVTGCMFGSYGLSAHYELVPSHERLHLQFLRIFSANQEVPSSIPAAARPRSLLLFVCARLLRIGMHFEIRFEMSAFGGHAVA
jgi:hypothetical protein